MRCALRRQALGRVVGVTVARCALSGTGAITSTITLSFASQVPQLYDVFKLSRKQGKWFDISNRAVFNPARDVVTYTVTDNDPEDDDNPAPDIIADPVGLVVMPGGGSGGAGGGGGCFIVATAYGSEVAPRADILHQMGVVLAFVVSALFLVMTGSILLILLGKRLRRVRIG